MLPPEPPQQNALVALIMQALAGRGISAPQGATNLHQLGNGGVSYRGRNGSLIEQGLNGSRYVAQGAGSPPPGMQIPTMEQNPGHGIVAPPMQQQGMHQPFSPAGAPSQHPMRPEPGSMPNFSAFLGQTPNKQQMNPLIAMLTAYLSGQRHLTGGGVGGVQPY